MPSKTILITGCSEGGIGWALARSFQKRGHTVYAGLRSPQKAGDLANLPNVKILTLDVTKKETITAAIETIKKDTNSSGLDVLINNAGHGAAPGPLVEADLAGGRQLFEVNFWGLLEMVQASTPLLVRSRGSVVNISSVGSIIHAPYIGLYAASKAAVTLASNTMRLELKPLGVKVMTVMAGLVRTKFGDNLPPMVLPDDSYYKKAETFIGNTPGTKGHSMAKREMPVEQFADKLVDDILGRKSAHVWLGGMARISGILHWLLPGWLMDWALVQDRGLDLVSRPSKDD